MSISSGSFVIAAKLKAKEFFFHGRHVVLHSKKNVLRVAYFSKISYRTSFHKDYRSVATISQVRSAVMLLFLVVGN
jgi:hypothetical protein